LKIPQSGIAAAKNHGVCTASGPLILFFDDDDIADENLLAEHLKTHQRYPLDNVAVLGYTNWASSLKVNEVMRYVTDIGHYLFSYTHLQNGQRLDFTYFWGGRSSCKTSLLRNHGLFREEFEFGSEDIELGFRLSKRLVELKTGKKIEVDKDDVECKHRLATLGVAVIYNQQAIQHMNRPLTYDQFCRRCERQGKSQWQFSQLHPDAIVKEWCMTNNALEHWRQVRGLLLDKVARVRALEEMLENENTTEQRNDIIAGLHNLYWWTFDALKTKGIVEAMGFESDCNATTQTPKEPETLK
jgi:cellulose synthase/poly-beta-1,6-N-acetylglucosamine synthase-like glycosyltransferase